MAQQFSAIFKAEKSARLDKALMQLIKEIPELSGTTRSQIQGWIESGAITVDEKVLAKPGVVIKPGSCVSITPPAPALSDWPPYDYKLDIIYEDSHLLVIDKPAGLPMHPGAGNREKTLVNALVHHCGKEFEGMLQSERPGIVHRLDKDTTGIVVVAKSVRVLAELAKQFKDRTVNRAYRALVFYGPRTSHPVAVNDSGSVEGFIARDPKNRLMMRVSEQGKRAVTHWQVMERFGQGALLNVKLATGRTHQIRVHMNSIGTPVVGDRLYGNFAALPKALQLKAQRFGRQALHAALLEFQHPVKNERMRFERECPADMLELIAAFRSTE